MWTLPLPGLDSLERPRLAGTAIRQLVRLGTIARWAGLVLASVIGFIVPPRAPIVLVLLLIWVAVYNSWTMAALTRVDDAGALRLGRGVILLDCISYFALLGAFMVVPPPAVYAVYPLLIVWFVAYDGAEGAMLALAIFVIGMIGLQAIRVTFLRLAFNGTDVLLWCLIMAFTAIVLAAFDRIVIGSVPGAPATPAGGPDAPALGGALANSPAAGPGRAASGVAVPTVRLSPREQEVLQLVAQGYSNAMMAARLHLSENTIKTYVETLLTRLNARNRAEAVAAALRLNLI